MAITATGVTPTAPDLQRPKRSDERRHSRSLRLRETLTAWTFLTPTVLLVGVFLIVPVLLAFVLSFKQTSGFGPSSWIGLRNYTALAKDGVFWRSFLNTAVFTIATVPIEMAVGLGVALLFNTVMPARALWRTLVYLPMVISGVATGMIGTLMFDENVGYMNKLLAMVGLGPVHWQTQGFPALLSVIMLTLWTRIGFNMVIYLAGVQGISPEMHEAARVEGASAWQRFRLVTLPLLGPSTFFLLIMNVIASFQIFDTVFVLTDGGPGDSTSMLVTYAYQNGFQTREQGYAAAIGVVLFVVTMAFTALQWKFSRHRDTVG